MTTTTLTLNGVQVASLIASLEATLRLLKPKASTVISPKPRASRVLPFRASRSNVSVLQDRVLKRNAKIARGFASRGIRLTFDKVSGKFNNVKPYSTWLAEGRQVKRGQHGICGFFHISQTEAVGA